MALDPGSIVTAIDLVQRAIEIYQRIEALPQQMTQLGRRMERLNVFLVQLEAFVRRKKPGSAYARLFSGQKEALGLLLSSIKEHSEKVYDLFERYEKGILSRTHDLQFRVKWAAQIWFSLVDSSPEKIQAIMDDIDYDRGVLSDYMTLMNVYGVEVIVDKAFEPQAQAAGAATKKPAAPKTLAPAKRPSPSPSPAPPRKDFKIIFVDPLNQGRGVVAEAFVKLLGGLTLVAKRQWRISIAHSAGFFVKNRSNCADVVENLEYSYKSFKRPLEDGAKAPSALALAALFDNKSYDYPFKADIRDAMTARRSRGLRKDVFKQYDFIIVFTNRDHDNMIKLKEALRKEDGSVASARGKGRVLHLGTFLADNSGGPPREITTPPKKAGSTVSRNDWNRKVAEIKTAVKAFLKQEMGWTHPSKKEPAGNNLVISPSG
jgi:hypothetical protein